MKLSLVDYKVLRAAHSSCNQGAISKAAGTTPNVTTRSLLKLAKLGALTASRGKAGVKLAPRIAAVFDSLQMMEAAANAFIGAALSGAHE